MNIKNEESFSEQYAIISYSHSDTSFVKSELSMYDKHGICYWFDEQMQGGESYKKQFFEKLDNENCKGIIFFISESFLLSSNCADEMEYFLNNYKCKIEDNEKEKFCFFVLPDSFPLSGSCNIAINIENIMKKIREYAEDYMGKNPDKIKEIINRISNPDLSTYIEWFLKLSENGETLYGVLENKNNYIENYCGDEQIFRNYGIIFGHKKVDNEIFGYFPQNEKPKAYDSSNIEKEFVERMFDKAKAYYAPVEWIVIKDDENSQWLLSKYLLFTIDYLSLMYPFTEDNVLQEFSKEKKVQEYLESKFKLFNPFDDKRKIKKIRFLKESEFEMLLKRRQNNIWKKNELLLPDFTFYSQISNKKDIQAFWLAGDMEDARRVDTGIEGLSDQPAGVELFYVRVVIEVEKS